MLIVGPLDDLHHSLVVGLATLQFTLGDDDIMNEGRILWNEEGPVLIHTQFTNDGIVGTTYNLNDHRLLDMLVATGHI